MSQHSRLLITTSAFLALMSATQAFIFLDNSHAMLEAVCQRTPWFVRSMARKNIHKSLTKHLNSRNNNDVTEDLMFTVCKEVTPSLYLDETLKVLDSLKTKELN